MHYYPLVYATRRQRSKAISGNRIPCPCRCPYRDYFKKGERDDKKWRNEQEGEARELGLESRTESKTMHASVYVQLRRQRGK